MNTDLDALTSTTEQERNSNVERMKSADKPPFAWSYHDISSTGVTILK